MKKIMRFLMLLSMVFSSTSAFAQPERDGSSLEKAIVINAPNESKGVAAEYQWIKQHAPGWKKHNQSLVEQDEKYYDLITLKGKDGTERIVHFEITNFFGKM